MKVSWMRVNIGRIEIGMNSCRGCHHQWGGGRSVVILAKNVQCWITWHGHRVRRERGAAADTRHWDRGD